MEEEMEDVEKAEEEVKVKVLAVVVAVISSPCALSHICRLRAVEVTRFVDLCGDSSWYLGEIEN